MNIEDLQNLWRTQSEEPQPADDRRWTDMIAELRVASSRFNKSILSRDLREMLAAFCLVVWMGWEAWQRWEDGRGPWLCMAAAILPLGVLLFLAWDSLRHRHLQPEPGAPLKAELRRSLARLQHQERLLRNVVWWYVLPMAASGGLLALDAVLSADSPIVGITAAVLAAAIIIPVNLWIHRLNQRTVKNHLLPEIARFTAALDDLDPPHPTP